MNPDEVMRREMAAQQRDRPEDISLDFKAGQVIMASPQIENGHIDIANEIAEALMREN